MGPSSVDCLQLCLCLSVSQMGTTEWERSGWSLDKQKEACPHQRRVGERAPSSPPTPTGFPRSLAGSPRELQPLLISEPGVATAHKKLLSSCDAKPWVLIGKLLPDSGLSTGSRGEGVYLKTNKQGPFPQNPSSPVTLLWYLLMSLHPRLTHPRTTITPSVIPGESTSKPHQFLLYTDASP